MPGHNLLASRGGEEAIGIAIIGMFVLFFLVFFVAIYVYFALAFSTIARKTQTPNTWYAWVPILNMVLLLNVAKKPVWWVLLMFVPFLNLVILVLTWMGVAKARGRPDWWGVFIIAPIANFVLPGILAWSD
jgi:ABC-type Na+ efflux pump permease subunit